MAENVAMPHVLPAEVEHWFVTVTGAPVIGSRLANVEPSGIVGFRGRMLSGTCEGERRCLGPHGDDDVFQRVHADRFLPAQFVGIGRLELRRPSRPG